MAEYTTTTTYTVKCPECASGHVKKHGIQSGQQRYFCKDCKKAFRSNGKAEGRHMDAEMMGSRHPGLLHRQEHTSRSPRV